MVQKLINGYCRLLAIGMVLCLAAMVVMVFGNVVLRYAFNSGIAVSEEVSRWLFVWMTFMGGVVALNERGHLGTDSLIARLPVASSEAKSPRAWACSNERNVNDSPGMGTSTVVSPNRMTNTPLFAPPLCSCPVECR